MKLLIIGTDRKLFEKRSAVSLRQIEYAKKYEEIHIIVFAVDNSKKRYSETFLGSNIWVYPTKSISRWLYVFDALKLARFIVKRRQITNITCQDPFETGLVGALTKNRYDVNLELQIHTDISSPYFRKENFLNRIRMMIFKYTIYRADHIRVVSERIKNYISKYIDQSKIEIRPIKIDTEAIEKSPISINLHEKYSQFSKIVIMVSRLEPEKNIKMALDSWKIVLKEISNAGLIIIGSGRQEQDLKNHVNKIGINNSVVFEGWKDDLASYYKTADCLLVTSLYEGYGITFAEAKAAHCPIVSSDVGIAREAGARIVELDPQSIAHGIIDSLIV